MNRVLVAIVLCVCPALALAQHDPTAKTVEKRAAMRKLAPLLGVWTGESPIDPEPCDAFVEVWAFEPGGCAPFAYGGCEGNDNNFPTLEDCERACLGR